MQPFPYGGVISLPLHKILFFSSDNPHTLTGQLYGIYSQIDACFLNLRLFIVMFLRFKVQFEPKYEGWAFYSVFWTHNTEV